MIWVLIIYFGIGLLWSGIVTIALFDAFTGLKDFLMCVTCNILFWWLIMILAAAAGAIFHRWQSDEGD